MLIYPLAFILTLGLLVTFHEFGHYLVARLSGVGIRCFSVGFGRALWEREDRRGTRWVLAAIPLGGYVRMLDERDPEQKGSIGPDDLTYNRLSVWWRLAIVLAGPLANFALAGVVYLGMALAGAQHLLPLVGEPDPASPIAEAGMRSHQQIVSIDGQPMRHWPDVALALAERLGDSGAVRIVTRTPGAADDRLVAVPIRDWQQGEADPDLFGALGIQPTQPALIGGLMAEGPAERAGLQTFDRVLAVDDQAVTDWRELGAAVRDRPGVISQWSVLRAGQPIELLVEHASVTDGSGANIGQAGILGPWHRVSYSLWEAPGQALRETMDRTILTLNFLVKMVTGGVSPRNMGGPIAIGEVAGDSIRQGVMPFLSMLALLSISLGVLNLLPVPVLDGGHVVWCLSEIVTRRPVSERLQMRANVVGMGLLGALMLFVLVNDVARLM